MAGESAYTSVFAPREDPIQCYNCQEIGHKAFSDKKLQVCQSVPDKAITTRHAKRQEDFPA